MESQPKVVYSTMLKITTHSEHALDRFELEGRLAGPWVQELNTCWQQSAVENREICVVLKQVTFIDGEGRTLLAAMHRAGVTLEGAGCMTKAVIEEIVKGDVQ